MSDESSNLGFPSNPKLAQIRPNTAHPNESPAQLARIDQRAAAEGFVSRENLTKTPPRKARDVEQKMSLNMRVTYDVAERFIRHSEALGVSYEKTLMELMAKAGI